MRRPDLVSDCGSCAALCCVATSFDASSDFAFDKAAGAACRYLTRSCRCRIHDELVERGFAGCAAYECHGAGPRTTRLFAGIQDAEPARNEVFLFLRVVHELLWLATGAAELCPPSHEALRAQLEAQIAALDALASGPIPALLEVDLGARREAVGALLRRVGQALGGRPDVQARSASNPARPRVRP